MTDLVKYRVDTGNIITGNDSNAAKSFQEFLQEEIKWVNPKAIFSFGSRPWKTINQILEPAPVGENKEKYTIENVTEVHGRLFTCDNGYILPLTHFSGRNTFIRNAYSYYLEKVLDKLQENL